MLSRKFLVLANSLAVTALGTTAALLPLALGAGALAIGFAKGTADAIFD